MKKKLNIIVVAVLFLAGLSVLLYPFVANQWNSYRQSRLMSSYEEGVAEKEAAGQIDYEAEWEKARIYNDNLMPMILPDSFAVAEASDRDEAYMACLNINGDEVMGIVEIPKIDVELPIYHTTDEEVLQIGAGHLEGSSLPVGGESTHAVISAHRGLPSATLFTDLDKLEEGDHFLLHILDDTLAYEVDAINVVEPDETELLSVVEGEDLVTLLTCTPIWGQHPAASGAGTPGAVRAGRGGGGSVGFPFWEQPPYQLHFLGRCGAGADRGVHRCPGAPRPVLTEASGTHEKAPEKTTCGKGNRQGK